MRLLLGLLLRLELLLLKQPLPLRVVLQQLQQEGRLRVDELSDSLRTRGAARAERRARSGTLVEPRRGNAARVRHVGGEAQGTV